PVERHVPHEIVPTRIGPVSLDDIFELDFDAGRLAELIPAHGHKAMRPDMPRERHAGRFQNRRPDDAMKSRDVFAYEMYRRRPALLVSWIGISGRRQIVHEGFEPDIDRLRDAIAGWPREGNAPRYSGSTRGHVL